MRKRKALQRNDFPATIATAILASLYHLPISRPVFGLRLSTPSRRLTST